MSYYNELIIVGGKAGALICYDMIVNNCLRSYDHLSRYEVKFLESFFSKEDHPYLTQHVIPGKIDDNLERIQNYFVATGDNALREKITKYIISKTGVYPTNLIHRTASISKMSHMGYGNLVLGGATIHTNAIIGNGCIINTNAIVEHDNQIGNYTQISPGAVLCGYVQVGSHCMISANATVIPSMRIPNKTVLGAGAVLTQSIEEENCLYAGIPAVRKKKYES